MTITLCANATPEDINNFLNSFPERKFLFGKPSDPENTYGITIAPGARIPGFIPDSGVSLDTLAHNTLLQREDLPYVAEIKQDLEAYLEESLTDKDKFNREQRTQLYAVESNRGHKAVDALIGGFLQGNYNFFIEKQLPPVLEKAQFNKIHAEYQAAFGNKPELLAVAAYRCMFNDLGKNTLLLNAVKSKCNLPSPTHDEVLHYVFNDPDLRHQFCPGVNQFDQTQQFILGCCVKLSCFNFASFIQGETNVQALATLEKVWKEIKAEVQSLDSNEEEKSQLLEQIQAVYWAEVRTDIAGVMGDKHDRFPTYGKFTEERVLEGMNAVDEMFKNSLSAEEAYKQFLEAHIFKKLTADHFASFASPNNINKYTLMRLGLLRRANNADDMELIVDALKLCSPDVQITLNQELTTFNRTEGISLWEEYPPNKSLKIQLSKSATVEEKACLF